MEEEMINSRMNEIRTRLLTLEWDKSRNQLNAGVAAKYEALKAEYKELKDSRENSD